ncbi:MAG: rod-binding protein [Alphaproteobacteria bacterium]|nr:rod-binding protein [Alphaproteobacteria bacterium]
MLPGPLQSPRMEAGLARAPETARLPRNEAKLRETARAYESFFLQQMLEFMSAGIRPDPNFGGGHGEGVYRSLLNEHHGRAIAARGGIGIADAVYRQMLRMQEEG